MITDDQGQHQIHCFKMIHNQRSRSSRLFSYLRYSYASKDSYQYRSTTVEIYRGRVLRNDVGFQSCLPIHGWLSERTTKHSRTDKPDKVTVDDLKQYQFLEVSLRINKSPGALVNLKRIEVSIKSEQLIHQPQLDFMEILFFYAVVIILLSLSIAFHTGHRVSCKYQKVCNGNLMCAFVCERGSVNLDSWIIQSLNYQKKLQRFDDMVFLEMPSTHNSAITEADGFGIEKYFISALGGGVDLDQGDDMREGVSQHLSITDQMRMGVRHVEIDIWWDELIDGVIVCHTPVISPLKVEQINLGAQAANLSLVWEPKNTSCRGTKRTFVDVLTEVKDFMHQEENLEDVVVLFLDTKFYLSPLHVTKANKDILSVFGTTLWTYTDGNPFGHTVDDLLSKKKRVIIENNKEEWLHPSVGKPIVFFPPLWSHQFDSKSFEEFPSCSVEGDQDWYGNTWVRALADNTMTEPGTRCGVQLSSK